MYHWCLIVSLNGKAPYHVRYHDSFFLFQRTVFKLISLVRCERKNREKGMQSSKKDVIQLIGRDTSPVNLFHDGRKLYMNLHEKCSDKEFFFSLAFHYCRRLYIGNI